MKHFVPAHLCVTLIAVAILIPPATAHAQWAQWGGPHRDFRLEDPGLATAWPVKGPRRIWRKPLGEGESAISADGGLLYTMYRKGDDEVVIALRADNGETVWSHSYRADRADLDSQFGKGPRSTPLVHGERVFTFGNAGHLHAFDKHTGKVLWAFQFDSSYVGGEPHYGAYGYAASPIAYGDTVIVPGGGSHRGVMAFRISDGEIAWRSPEFDCAYSSPILIKVSGDTQLVALMAQEIVGLDPHSGRLLWQHPHPTRAGMNSSTPVWDGERTLYISSGYAEGTRALRLEHTGGETTVKELWHERELQTEYTNVLLIDDHLYGTSGHSLGPTAFVILNARTGDVVLKKRGPFKRASFLHVGEKVLLLDEDGLLALASFSPSGVELHASHQITKGVERTVPTLVGTTLFVRDTKEIVALDLGHSEK